MLPQRIEMVILDARFLEGFGLGYESKLVRDATSRAGCLSGINQRLRGFDVKRERFFAYQVLAGRRARPTRPRTCCTAARPRSRHRARTRRAFRRSFEMRCGTPRSAGDSRGARRRGQSNHLENAGARGAPADGRLPPKPAPTIRAIFGIVASSGATRRPPMTASRRSRACDNCQLRR